MFRKVLIVSSSLMNHQYIQKFMYNMAIWLQLTELVHINFTCNSVYVDPLIQIEVEGHVHRLTGKSTTMDDVVHSAPIHLISCLIFFVFTYHWYDAVVLECHVHLCDIPSQSGVPLVQQSITIHCLNIYKIPSFKFI